MKYLVDVSAVAVAVCLDCDCRFLARDRLEAMVMLAGHEARAHPDSKRARSNLARTRSKPCVL